MGANTKNNAKLTIGRLANAAGMSIATVRYYQRRKLLPLPNKPAVGGFREYSEEDLARLQLIRRTQEMGFTLAEVLELLSYIESGDRNAIILLAGKKLQQVQEQAEQLNHMQHSLSWLVTECEESCPADCPFINELLESTRA
ncbi:MAG: MerR family transcriptional regulator [Zoogloeaceae bacterium]|nr:MerR family transcriptional regulator [Zoogloeaceae bacterium]